MKTASKLKVIIEATQKHDQWWFMQIEKKNEEISSLKKRLASRDLNLSHCHAEIERLEEENNSLIDRWSDKSNTSMCRGE